MIPRSAGMIIFSELTAKVTSTVSGIMNALSSAQRSEVKAWEEEILACEHSLTLVQEPVIMPGQGQSSQRRYTDHQSLHSVLLAS